jgi:drug/metabolite transporter (DMT)-like permease
MGLAAAWALEPATARFSLGQVSAASWAAWLYLVVMGTLVTLNAYLWLLQNATPAVAGSYSFVNPAVALWVGVALGGEVLTGWVYLAMPLVLAALALILYGAPLVAWGGRLLGVLSRRVAAG